MVDTTNVIISGLDTKVPKWATEATLKEMDKSVTDLVNVLNQKKKLKGVDTKKAQDSVDDFESALKKLNVEQKKSTKEVKSFVNNIKQGFNNPTTSIGGIFKTLISPAGLVAGAFTLAGGAVSLFIDYLSETSQALLGLYDNGILVQDSLGGLRLAAATAALPLNEFSELLVKNGSLIKALGGNGVQSFANITKSTRNLIREQGYYGLGISQISGYTADYLEILRSQGVLQGLTDNQRSRASADYIKELTTYSQVLGKSREAINKDLQEAIKNPNLRVVAGALGSQGAQFIETLTKSLGPLAAIDGAAAKKVTEDFITSIGTLEGPLTDTYKGLLAAGRSDLAADFLNLSKAVRDNSITSDEAQARQLALLKGIQNIRPQDFKNLSASLASSSSSLYSQAQLIAGINSSLQGADLSGIVSAPDDWTRAVTAITNTFTEIRASFSATFAKFIINNQPLLNKIVKNFADFAQYLAQKLQVVLDVIGNLIDPKTREATLKQIGDGVRSLIDVITQYIGDELKGRINPLKSVSDYKNERVARATVSKSVADYSQSGKIGVRDQIELTRYLADTDGQKALTEKGRGFFGRLLQKGDKNELRSFIETSLKNKINPATLLQPQLQDPAFKAIFDELYKDETKDLPADQLKALEAQNAKLDKIIELQTQNNDHVAKGNEIQDQTNSNIKAVNQTAKSNPNIIR